MAIDLNEYKSLYLKTAREYVAKMKKNITSLEEHKDTKDLFSDLHISAHSLKSQSLVMGYKHTGTLSFHLEKLFKGLKEETLMYKPEIKEVVSKALESLDDSIDLIEQSGEEKDLTEIAEDVLELVS